MEPDTTSRNLPEDMTLVAKPGDKDKGPPSAPPASLVVIAGWEIGAEFPLQGNPLALGRSAAADLRVNEPSVSRMHARIERQIIEGAERFTLTDLGSSNGTSVNEKPAYQTPLHNGDRVRVGEVVLKFVQEDELDAHFHQEVHRLIHYDQLTGLLTMETFRRRLDARIRQTEPERPFTLAMTDLDGLKRVNDTYGHLAGRMVVREMGGIMRQVVRRDDLAALYGGDEAVLLFEAAPIKTAQEVAETLREAIETRKFEHQGNTFQVTISQGLAEWPRHGATAEALIAAADRALYAAKEAGRNRVCTA